MTPTLAQQRRKLQILITLFLLPVFMVVAAGSVYWMNVKGISLFGDTRQRGELLSSPYPSLDTAALTVLRGEHPIQPPGQRFWWFLQTGEAQCDEACINALWESRQTRAALGRLSARVQRAYIVLDEQPQPALLQWLETEHPDMAVWHMRRADWEALVGREAEPVKLYFADRLGYVIMRYRPDHTYKDILKDMSFLIRHN